MFNLFGERNWKKLKDGNGLEQTELAGSTRIVRSVSFRFFG